MRGTLVHLIFSTIVTIYIFQIQAQAAPATTLVIKQLSSILKWTSTKSPVSDGNNILLL
ncbi:hypothetical protein HanXRQr2_Chr05g0223351 [Helianthus annuus]|uniref:Uncharacterized protein n=1 Tax=Helianthus annuus TaxID=4232 RepID=A0A9K3NPF0_HELAN|nr:hypothetical protein HanXRQr2_Chr05g0223351 [Helianthus annuus]KAJ0923420.1 hypothetical protein HanPSC8_Chr05g0215681 [Helianthus annuus]